MTNIDMDALLQKLKDGARLLQNLSLDAHDEGSHSYADKLHHEHLGMKFAITEIEKALKLHRRKPRAQRKA